MRALDQLPRGWRGHFGDGQAVGAEQAVNGIGGKGGEEFAFGIGMQVVLGRANQDGPRGDQGDQLVLVDRQFVFMAVVLAEIGAKPVREMTC